MRNIRTLTEEDIEYILQDAPKRCYSEIADELDIPVNTVKKVVRQHNHARLKRYK
jgi:DNA-directed RNA polymerase specialized sigma24 family protein